MHWRWSQFLKGCIGEKPWNTVVHLDPLRSRCPHGIRHARGLLGKMSVKNKGRGLGMQKGLQAGVRSDSWEGKAGRQDWGGRALNAVQFWENVSQIKGSEQKLSFSIVPHWQEWAGTTSAMLGYCPGAAQAMGGLRAWGQQLKAISLWATVYPQHVLLKESEWCTFPAACLLIKSGWLSSCVFAHKKYCIANNGY